MMRNKTYILFLMLLVWLTACSPAPAYDAALLETLTPMSDAVRQTLTARALEAAGGGNQIATAAFQATETAMVIHHTQTARADLYEPARLATATAVAPMLAELPRYEVNPNEGRVAWLHAPVSIALNGYEQNGFANDYPLVTGADFVIVTDITWDSKNSLGGCGFLFRSDGNPDKPSQYVLLVERTVPGRISFAATYEGELSNYRMLYPADSDQTFNWTNLATNRLAMVVKGDLIDVYTNGTHVGQIDIKVEPPPVTTPKFSTNEQLPIGITEEERKVYEQEFEKNKLVAQEAIAKGLQAAENFKRYKPFYYDGLLGFASGSDTGSLTCTFDNSWLFLIED
ncbi:MAG: hypothetical protein JEZ00_20610 [Anaerolineaceae bacterium]|nr:hypothetical protein [Anaerolineaceae bacterium]